MIQDHLLVPTIFTVAPIALWGIWIVSEKSFDILAAQPSTPSVLTEILRIFGKTEEFADKRTIRQEAIKAIFSICFVLFWICYFLFFVAPNLAMPILLILVFSGSLGIHLFRGQKRQKQREIEKFEAEIPTFMQLMTVLISSGISPTRAIDLLTRRPSSICAKKLREVVTEVDQGKPIVEALDHLATMNKTLILSRFTTAIILGTERGSSLTPVLISQVKDARNAQKNKTMQQAGRAEIALMIPVVFLILPISILFALWPSYQQLGTFL